MSVRASTVITEEPESYGAGLHSGKRITEDLDGPPKIAVAYATVNHDQSAFLAGLRDALGPDVPVIGCSAQGIMGREFLKERGYVSGVMGLAGDSLNVEAGQVHDISVDTLDKGRALGRSLKSDGDHPKTAILLYDPLCGADMDPFLEGIVEELQCPVIGGGAGHFHGSMKTTYQFFGDQVFSGGAVAIAIAGDFTVETALSTGCSPVGVDMTVTKADGTCLLELDGQSALEVWQEITGSEDPEIDHSGDLALGVPLDEDIDSADFLVRAAFGVDRERGGIVLQSAIPTGTKVALHHRTNADVLDGTAEMGGVLLERLAGKTVRVAFGFECGARTEPFLGTETAKQENSELQDMLAPDAEWLGMTTWGEIYSYGLVPTFNNYTYPLLLIAD